MPILEVKGLRKSFGGLMAVAGIDLEAEDGHIRSAYPQCYRA
jgi:ABC-type branched-subunit amino acid transport system ATPase component